MSDASSREASDDKDVAGLKRAKAKTTARLLTRRAVRAWQEWTEAASEAARVGDSLRPAKTFERRVEMQLAGAFAARRRLAPLIDRWGDDEDAAAAQDESEGAAARGESEGAAVRGASDGEIGPKGEIAARHVRQWIANRSEATPSLEQLREWVSRAVGRQELRRAAAWEPGFDRKLDELCAARAAALRVAWQRHEQESREVGTQPVSGEARRRFYDFVLRQEDALRSPALRLCWPAQRAKDGAGAEAPRARE